MRVIQLSPLVAHIYQLCNLGMSFSNSVKYKLVGFKRCQGVAVRPSDSTIGLACYNVDHINYVVFVNLNGSVSSLTLILLSFHVDQQYFDMADNRIDRE